MLHEVTQSETIETDLYHKHKIKRNLNLLYGINIFSSIHFFGAVMIPFFQDYGGLNFAEIMILESIFMGGIFVMEIPTGAIADKYSRKFSLNLAYLINIIAIGVYIIQPNFWIFALGESIWALAVALHSGAYDAMLYDTLVELGQESESKKHFSRLRSIGLIAMPIGALSGAFIASYFGLQATMGFSMIPLAISALLSFWLHEPNVHQQSKEMNTWSLFRKGLQVINQSKGLQRIIIDMVILSTIGYFGIWLYQKRLMHLGLEIRYLGMVQTGIIVFEVAFLNLALKLEKWLGSKKKVLSLAGLGIGFGFLLTGAFANVSVNILGFILAAGFGMTYQVLSINYMNKYIPSEQRATILSTASMLRQSMIMCINPLVGFGVEWNIDFVLVGLGLCAVIWTLSAPIKEQDLLE